MGSVFYLVLNMGITASAAGALLLLIRLALRGRLPAQARYALWAIVLVRLVLPVSFPSEASFFNVVGKYAAIASVPAGDAGATITNSIGAANSYSPLHFKTAALGAAFQTAGIVWLAGAGIMAVCLAALYLLTASRLRTAVRVDDGGLASKCAGKLGLRRKIGLYASGSVSSPIVFGLVKPRIIIPPAMAADRGALRYALLHELVHIRRGDNILRAASALVLCVHWFNPFAWLFFMLAGRDMELACDAGVLKRLTEPERRGYAMALAGLAESRQPLLAAAFGRSAVRQRIVQIVKYKRLPLAAAALTALLLLALAVALLSNPAV